MTNNMKRSPNPIDVQDFQFKKSSTSQIFEAFTLSPNSSNLIVADKRRGLLYICHHKNLTVLKPAVEDVPESRSNIDLPDVANFIAINCDCSYLALCFSRPSILIYDASGLCKNNLNLITELQISVSFNSVYLMDLQWNPTSPNMLCTIASDYSIGSFQVKTDKQLPPTKLPGLEALCVAWSPKGKQLAIGCRNGNIIQLKPELKVARTINGPAPPIGEIIDLLWISNFQFCGAYFEASTQTITVVIVDAPKGVTQASFTCYDSLLNRIPEESIIPRFYFEHIAEWGVIIAASNDCNEVGVIGTTDSGATWVIWQMESNARAELPMVKRNDSYPIGLTIDRSTTNKIYLDAENIAKHPFPILHILGTSGHLVSFYIANLKQDSPCICTPPVENVVLASSPKSVSEISFAGSITSTPLIKQPEPTNKPVTNLFGSATAEPKGFSMEAQAPFAATLSLRSETQPVEAVKPLGFFAANESKTMEVKNMLPATPVEMPKMVGFPLQKEPARIVDMPAKILESVQADNKPDSKEPKESSKQTKPAAKTSAVEKKYDDVVYIRAYHEEWVNFEHELKNKLETPVWNIGSEEEKQMIVKKAFDCEEGLSDMTVGLNDDLSCTKSLLLQSFAWLEEAKSRRSSSGSVGHRNKSENLKMKERENAIYYLRSQIQQINNSLDLKWLEESTQKEKKMKIPSVEFLYMTLLRQEQVVNKQKSNLDIISKKVKSLGKSINVSSLSQSMSSLKVSNIPSTLNGDKYGIEMRCKAIAERQKNFTRTKNEQLREVLMETTPKVIKPVCPSSVEDRLNSILSSLATTVKFNEPTAEVSARPKLQAQSKMAQQQKSPLPLLNNLVSRLGSDVSSQSSFQMNSTTTMSSKTTLLPPVSSQLMPKCKSEVVTQAQTIPSFSKLDNIKFAASTPAKTQEVVKEGFVKITSPPAEQQKIEAKAFPSFSIKPVIPTTGQEAASVPKSTAVSSSFLAQKPPFSVPGQQTTTNLFGAKSAGNTFSFTASATAAPPSQPNQPLLQSTINLGSLTMGLQQPEFLVSSSQASNVTSVAPIPSPLLFKTPQTSLFAKTVPATTSSPSSIASGMVIAPAFCRSTTTSATITTFSDKVTSSISSSVTAPPATVSTQSTFSFGTPQPIVTATTVAISTVVIPAMTSSVGLFISTTSVTTATTTATVTVTTPSTFSFISGGTSVPASTAAAISSTSPVTTSPTFSNAFNNMLSATSNFSFSPTATTTTTTSIFGGNATPQITPLAANIISKTKEGASMTFGGLTVTPVSGSMFGGTATTTATPATTANTKSVFGSGTAATSPFSVTHDPSFATTTTTTSVLSAPTFGVPASTSVVSQPTFGATTSAATFGTVTTSASTFGTATTGAPTFGTATTSATTFSIATTSVPTFGAATTSTPTFGTVTTSTPTFGTATTSTPTFGTATTSATTFGGGAVFGATTANTGTVFGSPTGNTGSFGSIFGNANAANTAGGTSLFGGKSPSTTGSMFGGTAAPTFGSSGQASMFGDASKTQSPIFGASGAGIFGAANQPASPLGGGMMGATTSPVFGQSATFGGNPVFGSPTTEFGSKPVFGSGFGSTAFGGGPTNAGFGSPPAMGASLPQMGSPGTMDKVFGGGGSVGSNTFESLANQPGGLSFGSLAQKTTEPQQTPAFPGGNAFSSWR